MKITFLGAAAVAIGIAVLVMFVWRSPAPSEPKEQP